MMHTNKRGDSKLLKNCQLPITGKRCVKKIFTDIAVMEVTKNGFLLIEKASDVTIEEIIKKTEGNLEISKNLKNIDLFD